MSATPSGFRARGLRVALWVGLLLAVGAVTASYLPGLQLFRHSQRALPFPGAREVELACVDERRPPTRAEIDTLVEALLEAYGGRERLLSMGFARKDDLFLSDIGSSLSNHAVQETWYRRGRSRVNTGYQTGKEQRILFEGISYLATMGMRPDEARGETFQHVWLDYQRSALPGLLVWEETTLTPLAPRVEVVDGDEHVLVGLEVDIGTKPKIAVWIDPLGPVIDAVDATLPLTGDQVRGRASATNRIRYRDFDRVQGFLVSRHQDLLLDAGDGFEKFAILDLIEITFFEDPKAELDDSLFRP